MKLDTQIIPLFDLIGTNLIAPGVGATPEWEREVRQYQWQYYWILAYVYGMAALFHAPYFVWLFIGASRFKQTCQDVKTKTTNEQERNARKQTILRDLLLTHKANNIFAYRYIGCEIANLVVLICAVWASNWFLGN